MKKLALALCLLFVFAMIVRADENCDVIKYMEKLANLHKELMLKHGDAEKFLEAEHHFKPVKFDGVVCHVISVFVKKPYISVCFNFKGKDGKIKTVYRVVEIKKIENGINIHSIIRLIDGAQTQTVAYYREYVKTDEMLKDSVQIDRSVTDQSRFDLKCLTDCIKQYAPDCMSKCFTGGSWTGSAECYTCIGLWGGICVAGCL
jgi:hypothetical protein